MEPTNRERASWKEFAGHYLVFRKVPHRAGMTNRIGGNRIPNFRHKTIDAAKAEAERLQGLFPESTFIIMQEVARIKPGAVVEQSEAVAA